MEAGCGCYPMACHLNPGDLAKIVRSGFVPIAMENTAKSLGVPTERKSLFSCCPALDWLAPVFQFQGDGLCWIIVSPYWQKACHRVIPVCGMVGMVLVLLSDFIAKTMVTPAEIPVGLIIVHEKNSLIRFLG